MPGNYKTNTEKSTDKWLLLYYNFCFSLLNGTTGRTLRYMSKWSHYGNYVPFESHFFIVYPLHLLPSSSESVCASWQEWWQLNSSTEKFGRRVEPMEAEPKWEEVACSPFTLTGGQQFTHSISLTSFCNKKWKLLQYKNVKIILWLYLVLKFWRKKKFWW